MKKRFLKVLIIFSFLFCLGNVGAKECLTIHSTGQGKNVGYYYQEYYNKYEWEKITSQNKVIARWNTSKDAEAACKRRSDYVEGKTECKVYSEYQNKYYCNGASFSSEKACNKHTYTVKGTWSKRSTGSCKAGLGYTCSLNSKKYVLKSSCEKACVKYACTTDYSNTCVSGNPSSDKNCKTCKAVTKTCGNKCAVDDFIDAGRLKYGYEFIKKDSGTTEFWSKNVLPLTIFEYRTDGNDRTYCIQPGKTGPGSGTQYCLNQDFDLSRCKTEDHYFCGFADILYKTVKQDGTYSDGSVKFVDNGKYDFPEITTALRMWVAYAANGKIKLSDGEIITGLGEASDEYSNVTKTDPYLVTANWVAKNKYNGMGCSKNDSYLGVLCTSNGLTTYLKAIELFRAALDGKHEFLEFEANSATNPSFSHTSNSEGAETTFTVITQIPETFQEKMVDCTKQEILNKRSDCKVYAALKDENGNTVNGLIEDAKCEGKESCEFVIKAKRKECFKSGGTITKTDTKYTLNLTLKGYSRGGYVRQYYNANGANASQIMLTFAFNEKKNEIEDDYNIDDPKPTDYHYTLNVPCYCDPKKYCENFKAKGYLKNTCEGYGTQGAGAYDTYEKSTYEDPYMNCILNPCDPSKKEEFSYTKETGANSKVCNIYCRKELTFYLANKTKVYAGMQFSYDVAPKVLQGEGDIEDVLTKNHKLTSIVLQKRQCTSEIYYNKKNAEGKTWIEQYDTAVKNMISAYNDWKKIEVLYDWEVDYGGPYKINAIAKKSYKSTATKCGQTGCSVDASKACSAKTIYTWPKYDYIKNESGKDTITEHSKSYQTWKINSSCKANSKGEVVCTNSKGSVLSNNLQLGTPNTGVKSCDRIPCCTSLTCRCGNAVTCGSNSAKGCTPKADTKNCCCDSTRSTNNSCTDGTFYSEVDSSRIKGTLIDEEEDAWNAFKAAVKVVEQLYYDLQNCNFYVDPNGKNAAKFSEQIVNYYTDLKGEHHPGDTTVTPSKSNGGSIKDFLLEQSYCKNDEDCVSLVLGYEDDYGENTKFSKNVDKVDSVLNNNYYCKNTSTTKCYEYKEDEEVEIERSNATAKHDKIVCSGVGTSATCHSNTINLPVNDYATFITVTEADFWQPKAYKASVYTGVVSEDDGSASAGNSTPLGKEVFPVSNKTRKDSSGRDIGSTGSYDVKHTYSNLGLTSNEKFDFEYACNYEVYNTTKYYDCETNENGITDLTKCKNPCYELKDGVPVITDSCDIWTPKDNNSKSYGFIYRNVDVGNLFPGESIRDTGINWSSKTDVIDAIEKTADTIYTTDDYLEYRYVLTPSNIRQIREYNSSQNSNGGYLNETLQNCTMVDDDGGLKAFTECKSTFLDEIKAGKFGDIKVSGSKS